jgi:hypothetical protein
MHQVGFIKCTYRDALSTEQKKKKKKKKDIIGRKDHKYSFLPSNELCFRQKQQIICLYTPRTWAGINELLWAGRSGGRIPVGAKFSASVQNGPGGNPLPPNSMGIGSFPGLKRPRCGFDHPPHLAQRLKKE